MVEANYEAINQLVNQALGHIYEAIQLLTMVQDELDLVIDDNDEYSEEYEVITDAIDNLLDETTNIEMQYGII